MLRELQLYRDTIGEFSLSSLYFGGGTPSRYTKIGSFLQKLAPPPWIETTLEANPEDITYDKMKRFSEMGINRVSIGVQSLVDYELSLLGREHTAKRAIQAIHDTYRAGITNISIDLMYELPYQTLHSFSQTLAVLEDLPITHLSLYNLTFEDNTVFTKHKARYQEYLPSDREALLMLERATSTLETLDLHRYEISAFAKPGFEAKHNTSYWKAAPFLGLGPSAFSYLGGARFQNAPNLRIYETSLQKETFPVTFFEKLSQEASTRERLAVHLRLFSGAPISNFSLTKAIESDLHTLSSEGYISLGPHRIQLTPKGRLFYDHVGATLTL